MRLFVSTVISACIYCGFAEYARLIKDGYTAYERLIRILKTIREDIITRRKTLLYSVERIEDENIKNAFNACISAAAGKKKADFPEKDFVHRYALKTVEAVCSCTDIDILKDETDKILSDAEAERDVAQREYRKRKSLISSIGTALSLVVFIMLI